MGGRIDAESSLGKGSVFSFIVPFEIRVGAELRTLAPRSTAPEAPLPALRILLVEDSPDNRTIIAAFMLDTPYQVELAENGAIACEKFKTRAYDLVLMDRQMPVMDGLAATRAIRAWEVATARPPTPILALTASALKGDREMCLAAGCTAFLTKPIKEEVLLQAIKEHTPASTVATQAPAHDDRRAVPIVVRTKAKFAHLVPSYLDSCRHGVVEMRDALERVDFAALRTLGHDISGSGGAYGFQAITDIGASLQQAAESADSAVAGQWIAELADYLDRVETVAD
jgi:CheY-like chemotaxis protein/HPt (histidine-containing phosphotransfer) domain-containing protein